jgi:hypothetical protein
VTITKTINMCSFVCNSIWIRGFVSCFVPWHGAKQGFATWSVRNGKFIVSRTRHVTFTCMYSEDL